MPQTLMSKRTTCNNPQEFDRFLRDSFGTIYATKRDLDLIEIFDVTAPLGLSSTHLYDEDISENSSLAVLTYKTGKYVLSFFKPNFEPESEICRDGTVITHKPGLYGYKMIYNGSKEFDNYPLRKLPTRKNL